MKLGSSPQERISDETNAFLFPLVSVIYGAVFSYAMYIFSNIIIGAYTEWDVTSIKTIYTSQKLQQIILFAMFMLYMIEDVGSIIKLGNLYPFKRTSRYTFEIVISLFYVCAFSLLSAGIYYCVIFFSFIVLLGGLWHNQFKEEYPDDVSNVRRYAVIERDIHYAGTFLLMSQAAILIGTGYRTMSWLNTIIFVVVLCLWMIIAARWVCLRSGEHVMKCKVMIFLPDYYVKKICNQQSTLTIK